VGRKVKGEEGMVEECGEGKGWRGEGGGGVGGK